MVLSLRVLVSLAVTLLFAHCQPNAIEPLTTDADYFPLETGRYILYDVEETLFSLNAQPIRRTYQLKELTGPAYTDVTGQTAYRLLRYRRSAVNQTWQSDSVWSVRLVDAEAIRTENGRELVKLVFPLSDGMTWDGNRRNASGEDPYQTRNSGQPYRVGDKQYDQTVTVTAQGDSTLLSLSKRTEVYARQVGLIFKERTRLQYCTASPGCVGKNQIDYGIRQVYRIRAYGTE